MVGADLLGGGGEADGEHQRDDGRELGDRLAVDAASDDRREVVVDLGVASGDDPVDVHAAAG